MAGTETTRYKDTPIDDLIPYARNARTHSEDQINKVASSIKEFGFLNPVIKDGEDGIIAGHCRVEAAKKLGYTQVPTIEASHLTDEQKRAYILADNRLALDAGWDNEMLSVEFADLHEAGFDLELTGFSADELSETMYGPDFEPGTEDEQGNLDELEPKWVTCPHCGEEFDERKA